MAYNIELHPIAEVELWEAVDWYDAQKDALGKAFAKELDIVVDAIKATPARFSKVLRNKRKAVMARFPYIIIFEVVGDTILILSIFHTSRNPTNWKER